MRTGRYRVRRGLFDAAVLQAEFSFPSLIGGHIDASVRQIVWNDVKFYGLSNIRFAPVPTVDDLPTEARESV